MIMSYEICRSGTGTRLSGFSLFLRFVPLALRIQLASLRDRSLDHAKILAGFPKPGRIILDTEGDWIDPSYAD
jgi:hypothetical protein